MQVTLSPKASNSSPKLNFTFKSHKYNQYVQTHMSWNEEKYLTKQEKEEILIKDMSTISKPHQLEHSKYPPKPSSLIRMPIPQFELSKMNSANAQDESDLKTTKGFAYQQSYLMNSQQASLVSLKPDQFLRSIQTQTEDFTFMTQLFSEPKIYQIPVQMQLEMMDESQQQKGVQTEVNQLRTVQYKLQLLQKAAVFRQDKLGMDLGVLSISVGSYEFQRMLGNKKESEDVIVGNGNDEHEREQQQSEGDYLQNQQQSQELLLENQVPNHNNNHLFRTARFEQPQNEKDFYTVLTPQKSRFFGEESSPDTTGPMRVSQTEINMMHTRPVPSTRIDEEEFEDLQNKFYLLEQDNAQKNLQIEVLGRRVEQLVQQLQRFQITNSQKSSLQEKYSKLQKQLNSKCQQLQTLQQKLFSAQNQTEKLQQSAQYKQRQLYQILQAKQKQLEQLQHELKSYRQQLVSGQEKYNKNNEAYENFISEKEQEISDIKAEHDRKYELYVLSIKDMKNKIQDYQIKMENLQNTILKKDAKINDYKEDYSKIKEENSILYKRIENLKEQFSISSSGLQMQQNSQNLKPSSPNNQQNFKRSFTKNQNRLNEDQQHNEQSQQVGAKFTINNSEKDINRFNHHNASKQDESQSNNTHFSNNQQNYELKKQKTLKNLHHKTNSTLPNTFISKTNRENSINYNQNQLSSLKPSHMQISDSCLQNSLESEENSEKNMRQQQGTISISESHQFSKLASYSFQKPSQMKNMNSENLYHSEQYFHELERILLIYEGVIEKQTETIEELQEKVLEFLKDALTKESEAEFLYSQLCQYENNLNGLMVQKLDLELEKQRLNKIITESESKLAVLGSRLIKLAKYNSSIG